MTVAGAAALTEELKQLKSVIRPKIIQAIAEARAHGDLKENAEYHAAREEQSFTEGRIQDLEAKLSNAQIIDPSTMVNDGKVIFGSTVTVINIKDNAELTYKIVGEDEVDLKANKISYKSPIGAALVGKSLDDTVTVKTPGGVVEYEIIEVSYL